MFALDDDAFKADIRLVENIFRIRVQVPRRSVQLWFKKSMLGTPIIRQAVSTAYGVYTSPTKALRYKTFLYYFQRLGIASGMMQILAMVPFSLTHVHLGHYLRRGLRNFEWLALTSNLL
jgi:hypothetical protein